MPQQYIYEGPRSEAVILRNRTKAPITIAVPLYGVDGKAVPGGVSDQREIVLLGEQDEGIDGSQASPECVVAKTDWEKLMKRRVIQDLTRRPKPQIEVYSAG